MCSEKKFFILLFNLYLFNMIDMQPENLIQAHSPYYNESTRYGKKMLHHCIHYIYLVIFCLKQKCWLSDEVFCLIKGNPSDTLVVFLYLQLFGIIFEKINWEYFIRPLGDLFRRLPLPANYGGTSCGNGEDNYSSFRASMFEVLCEMVNIYLPLPPSARI